MQWSNTRTTFLLSRDEVRTLCDVNFLDSEAYTTKLHNITQLDFQTLINIFQLVRPILNILHRG